MKRFSAVLAGLVALIATTGVAWARALDVPAPAKGFPSVVAAGESGATLVVWSTDEIYQGYGPLTVDTILSGPTAERRRWRKPNSLLADSARDRNNNLDLLVATGPVDRPGSITVPRLALYRAKQDGRVRRTWSGPLGANGVVARRGSTVAVVWVAYRKRVPSLHMVTSTRGRPFSRPRTVHGVLPRFLRTTDLGYINDLDLTLDADARPVIALTAWHRPAPMLVIAQVTRGGRVRTRQVTRGIDGLVQASTTRRGRVAVMADDTGVEGERGECVGDAKGRRLWATVRDRGATRFPRVRRLDAHPLDCASRGARLVSNVGERVWFMWTSWTGEVSVRHVRAAYSGPGEAISASITLADNAIVAAATTSTAGGLVNFFTTQVTDALNPYGGALLMQTISAAGVSEAEPVDPNGVGSVFADRNPGDTFTLLAWVGIRGSSLHLQPFGGQ
jgi:hypothetical protein